MPIGVLKQLHYNKYYKSSNFFIGLNPIIIHIIIILVLHDIV